MLFFLLDICFFLLAGAFFKNGEAGADPKLVSNLFVSGGAFLFGKRTV
jgi:hypothetical protein